jgi:uncharacterized YccA/Bax inhibitor family protein
MKSKVMVMLAVLLVISIGNYFALISDGTIRTVEFISITAIGALAGLLLAQIIKHKRNP